MALDKKKTQNIVTACVGGLALVLVVVVVLVKTGVIKRGEVTTQYMVTESTIVTVAVTDENGEEVTDENGDVVYYTMLDYYTRPGVKSNHVYPTTTKATTKTEPATTTEKQYYIEVTHVEEMTDKDGNIVTDENGEAQTKVVTATKKTDSNGNLIENGTTAKPTTTTTTAPSETTTKTIYVTDPISKKPIKNIKGEYVVSAVETEPPTTTTTTTTTTKPVVHVVGETSTTKKKTTTTTKKATTTTKKSTTAADTSAATATTAAETVTTAAETTTVAVTEEG